MPNYFKLFPTEEYSGLGQIRDITAAVTVKPQTTLSYRQPDALRPEVLADQYYGDPTYDWLLYLANDVTDPRDLVVLDPSMFDQMIVNKYGSVENAQLLTAFWINNWEPDESQISPVVYDSLPVKVKQLYNPVRDYREVVVGYKRKQEDYKRNTNQLVTFACNQPAFAINQIVNVVSNDVVVGRGQVASLTSTSVTIQHTVDSHTGDSVASLDGSVAFDITSVGPIVSCISDEELPYYRSVSVYEYEGQLNESKRDIKVVPNTLASTLYQQLRQSFT